MLKKLFGRFESNPGPENGTRALLNEIRKHQRLDDDITFGALVVLYDMGRARGVRLRIIERWSMLYGGLLVLMALTIAALHSEVPWLTGLLDYIFGR